MNILVLGGSGSIGLALIESLLNQDPHHRITATCGEPARMKLQVKSVNWLSHQNHLSLDSITSSCSPFNLIYIVSGSHTLRSHDFHGLFKSHSIPLMLTLDAIISSHDCSPTVVYASSANGIRALHLTADSIPQTPISYGVEKFAIELFLLGLANEGLFKLHILRLNNVFNPYRSKQSFGVFNHFAKCISRGLSPQFIGDSETPKDYIYIRDLSSFLSSFASEPLKLPSVFELYGGLSVSARDLYDSMYYYYIHRRHLSPSRAIKTYRDSPCIRLPSPTLDIQGMIDKSFQCLS